MPHRLLIPITLLAMSICVTPAGGQPPKASDSVKHPDSGKALFMTHCASCHGEDAKGAGPAAVAMKVQPPDLTAISKRNNGKYPAERVQKLIRGEDPVVAHGSKDMPAWGPVLLALTPANQRVVDAKIKSLTDYLKSIQVK